MPGCRNVFLPAVQDLTLNAVLKPGMTNEAVTALGAGFGYLGITKVVSSFEPCVSLQLAHAGLMSRYEYVFVVTSRMEVLMPVAVRAHLVSTGWMNICNRLDKGCKRVRIKVEVSRNSQSDPGS